MPTEAKELSAARAAAEWWAEQIGSPVHKVVSDDPDDPDRATGDFTFLAMQIIASRDPVSEEQGARFADALEKSIDVMLARGDYINLSVDYGPCMTLARAADEAGVAYSRFPFKTHMSCSADYVTAALGYRAPNRLIWQAPDWDRPPCGSMAYDESSNTFAERLCGLPRFHEGEHGDWQLDVARCARPDCGKSQAEHWNTDEIRHIFERVTS